MLEDMDICEVADAVWRSWYGKSDREVVSIMHQRGTPWSQCYEPGRNNVIPDVVTMAFYLWAKDRAERKAKVGRRVYE
jgi:hypothetical protein